MKRDTLGRVIAGGRISRKATDKNGVRLWSPTASACWHNIKGLLPVHFSFPTQKRQ